MKPHVVHEVIITSVYLFVYDFIAHALLYYVLAQCVPNSNMADRSPFHRVGYNLPIQK